MTTYESKKKIEAAIEYILPRVMKLDIEHELCTHVTCNRGPPSIPILSYELMVPGAGQVGIVSPHHATGNTIAVLEAILGKNFTITSMHSWEDDFVRVNLYATYSNTPRAEDPAWIGEMWPRLNRIRVTDNRVVWDPLPRYNAEDWEKELLDKVAAADQFIKQAHNGCVAAMVGPHPTPRDKCACRVCAISPCEDSRGSAALAAGRELAADRAAEGSDESDSEKLPDVVESKPEESLMSSDSDCINSSLLWTAKWFALEQSRAAAALEHRRNVLAAAVAETAIVAEAAPAAEAAMVAENKFEESLMSSDSDSPDSSLLWTAAVAALKQSRAAVGGSYCCCCCGHDALAAFSSGRCYNCGHHR